MAIDSHYSPADEENTRRSRVDLPLLKWSKTMRGVTNIIYAAFEFVPIGISAHLKKKQNISLLIGSFFENCDILRMSFCKRHKLCECDKETNV